MTNILRLGLVSILAFATATACDGDKDTPATTAGFDEAKLLRTMADNVILPAYESAVTTTAALQKAAAAWAASPQNVTAQSEAQEAWKAAMAAWQQAELFQVGPAGPAGVVAGGEGLRDTIYSWPSVNPCRIDQELVANNFTNDGFFDTALVNVGGLDAIEYVTFHEGGNQCPPQVDINANGTWNALSETEIANRRAAYASAAAGYVAGQAATLRNTWKNGFDDTFSAGSAPYEDRANATDDLIRALFYLELTTKDEKMAQPLGLQGTCSTDACPEQLESQWAHVSGSNVLNNLRAFRSAFTGEGGYGLQEALGALGQDAYAEETLADIDTAIETYEALSQPLNDLLVTDRATVENAYDDLKAVTDRLKGRILTALELRIPQEGGGDTD